MGVAGSVVTITPGEIHDGLPGHDEGWMYRMLYIDPEWVNRMVFQERFSGDHIHLFQTAMSQAPDFARTFLHQHQIIEKSPSSLERETILLDLVTQLFERSGAPIEPVSAAEQHAVQKIKKKLEDEFDKHLSLQELAQLVNLDPLYLIRVFKKALASPPQLSNPEKDLPGPKTAAHRVQSHRSVIRLRLLRSKPHDPGLQKSSGHHTRQLPQKQYLSLCVPIA